MLLAIGTVGYLPLVLPLLLPGVTVNSAKIAGWLFLLTLLPLAAGLALRARYGGLAARVKPVLDWVSNVALVPMVLLLAAANIDEILHVFGTRGILAGFLLIALGFGIGWMLGGPGILDSWAAIVLVYGITMGGERRPLVWRRPSPFSCGHVPQHGGAEHHLGQELLRFGVFLLERLQPPGVGDFHAAVPGFHL
jgi:hypothetical protein